MASMLTTIGVKEELKLSKTLNERLCSMNIHAWRACFSIRNCPRSHFQAITCKRENLNSLRLVKSRDVERRYFTCEHLLLQKKSKGFLYRIVMDDRKWIHYSNKKKRTSWELPRHASASLTWPNDNPAKVRCYLLWAIESGRNHRWWMVSPSIDAIEPSTAGTIHIEARKGDSIALQRLAPKPLNPT